MAAMRTSKVGELAFDGNGARVLQRAVAQGEVIAILSEGYIHPRQGMPVAFLVPAELIGSLVPTIAAVPDAA